MKNAQRFFLTVIFLVLFTACTPGSAEETPTSEPTATTTTMATAPAEPSATVTPTAEPATATPMPTTVTTTPSPEPGRPVQIRHLQMLDAERGWALGHVAQEQSARVLFTTDGGRTWQDHTPQEALPAETGRLGQALPAASFSTTQRGWVSYPHPSPQTNPDDLRVWSTTDGGQTWQAGTPLDLSGLPFEFFAPSDLQVNEGGLGWLMAHLGAGMSHDYVAVYTTTDGGQTWTRATDPDRNPDVQACNKSGLLFSSESDGWLAGDCPGLMPPLFLYHTVDGGTSWSPVTLPPPEGLTEGSLGDRCGVPQMTTVSSAALLLTLGCHDFDQGQSQAWLYRTPDGGQNWQIHALPISSGTFAFTTPQQGWLLGGNGDQDPAAQTLFQTTDGGQTWTDLNQSVPQGTIQFVDAQNGWLLNRIDDSQTLLRTADGGQTWQELAPMVVSAGD